MNISISRARDASRNQKEEQRDEHIHRGIFSCENCEKPSLIGVDGRSVSLWWLDSASTAIDGFICAS
jgi:hypothetical protein